MTAPDVCKCAHALSEHVVARTGGIRSEYGVCLVPGCGCQEFRKRDEPAYLEQARERLDRAEREALAELEARKGGEPIGMRVRRMSRRELQEAIDAHDAALGGDPF